MDAEPKGMGGWLLFFVITLTIRPLLGLVTALGALVLIQWFPSAAWSLGILATLHVAMAIYTAWMAYVFWKLKPNAVRFLAPYFGALLAYSLALVLIKFEIREPRLDAMVGSLSRSAIAGVVYVVIWTAYFRKSRRVAKTFRV